MLMHDHHLFKSPTIEASMVTADYYYPDWGCLVNIFFEIQFEKLLAMAAGD